ncbi:MAG: hypothetical protein OMM_02601 [Candidatus Magnetoglobus multicellularis str. Araruama]|uniref:Uncharacterized protein n=1 Tax=Candidatus Magnetoglobus multicellularis str. Araruama TaxID=890399 RepID=A0A1V1P948_9BACT|nr:MAG: hypothetical protein OMM_02601 [Candidatus Magnetoglobus multicellularis str. Araruama]
MKKMLKKLLLIGWDGADWDVINPLIDAGKMPNLNYLVDNGVVGDLTTLYPELSPMLWTSIATGKRAYKHGIYGFTEVRPDGQGIRPISNLSRKTKAIWNILSQNDISSHIIGWWPSHPVEPINGVMVSNLYPGPYEKLDPKKEWALIEGSVHPKRIAKNLNALRWHPQKLNTNHILPFVPKLGLIDQEKDHRLEAIAVIEYLNGLISFAEQDYKKALKHLKRAENLGYNNPNLFLKIASIYQQLNQVKEAIACYHKALNLDSNNAEAYSGLC